MSKERLKLSFQWQPLYWWSSQKWILFRLGVKRNIICDFFITVCMCYIPNVIVFRLVYLKHHLEGHESLSRTSVYLSRSELLLLRTEILFTHFNAVHVIQILSIKVYTGITTMLSTIFDIHMFYCTKIYFIVQIYSRCYIFWYWFSLANLKGATEMSAPPRVQILSFSCSFREKFGQIIGWRPHL